MSTLPDRRLQDRLQRSGIGSDISDVLDSLPDLSDNLREVDDDELESLKQELLAEAELRAERVERRIEEARNPKPPALPEPPAQPLDAEL